MQEPAKRLAPKLETLRELFLRSGNRCAFSGCNRAMINDDGVFVGQICHIEAAEVGGERFNPDMNNEERRSFSNLLLMCYDHHQVTNDVEKYTVDEMRRIKKAHESKFGDITQKMRDSIADYTDALEIVPAENLRDLCRAMRWNLSDEDLLESLPELNEFAERLKKLPNPTKELLAVALNRAKVTYNRMSTPGSLALSVSELKHTCDVTEDALREHLQLLDSYCLIGEADPEDFLGLPAIFLKNLASGWDVFKDLKEFCGMRSVPLTRIIVDLDFSILDAPP